MIELFGRPIEKIHVELTTNCNLKCPQCARYSGDNDNPYLKHSELTLDVFKNKITVEILEEINSIIFCGNFGDPIICKDVLKILNYIQDTNPNIKIIIFTNGSLRNENWWYNLAKNISNLSVVFTIDGLEDTHHIYRRGSNWSKLINNITSYSRGGGSFKIETLLFKHNEHQKDTIKELALTLGAIEIGFKYTTRPVHDDHKSFLELIDIKDNSINNIEEFNVVCRYRETNYIYLAADGLFYPCCWTAYSKYGFNDIERNQVMNLSEKAINLIPFKPVLNVCKTLCNTINGEPLSQLGKQRSKVIYLKQE